MPHRRVPFRLSDDEPRLAPLDGRPLIVHVVVNVERWPLDRAAPRSILPAPHGREAVPDVPNISWAEYGLRCGLPRIMRALSERGIPASVAINAVCLETHRPAAEAMLAAGWEFVGHGVDQAAMNVVDDPAGVVREALDRLGEFTGAPVRGWLGPGLRQSERTPELLVEAGVEYCLDWVVDDLPVRLRTDAGPLLAVPYSVELNDSVVYAVEKQPSPAILERVTDTVATFEREVGGNPRVLALPLHPHLIGVPHRIGYLERVLDLLAARDDVAFVTAGGVADWFTSQEAA